VAGNAAGPEPAEVRQERISALVEEQGFVRVSDLSVRFGVSTVTVRTDLQSLESHGRVRRIRGGAMPPGIQRSEQPFEVAEHDLANEKAAIGACAAALVADGDTVLLDVGTTTTAIARALVARADLRDVTVVTNGLTVALVLERAWPRISVVVTGGTLRPLQHSLVNPLGTVLLDGLNASIAFLGCNGVDAAGGVTNVNLPEAEVKKRMLKAAARRVVLADGSKIGRVELAHLCPVEDIHLVITGESADPGVVEALRERGTEVRLVA
jgi:DeoR family transcriptional regulator, aga operon transcriptional repressor